MKFEEILPAYREGAEVEVQGYQDRWIPMPKPGEEEVFSVGFLMNANFRIKPQKVKLFPILLKDKLTGKLIPSRGNYRGLDDFRRKCGTHTYEPIRIISEVPELIKEEDK